MPQTSPALGLPYLQPSQAQKHVTHNEALRILDAITQLTVTEPPLATPPALPGDGARYLVAESATGDWAGQDGNISLYTDGTWQFFAPQTGWRADVAGTGATWRFDGTRWASLSGFTGVSELGVNTNADATNRLAVSGPATLLTHEGAGHQLKLNKNAATDTASLLFQTSWSGRAEMGTTGSDDFAVKVSSDGASFATALSVAGNGAVQMPQGQCFYDEMSLADDAATGRDILWSDPARILLWIGVDAPGHSYLVSVTGALTGAANFSAIHVAPTGTLNLMSGALNGTTGPDGALNISINSGPAIPRLVVENRLGAPHLITLATLGR